MPRPLRIGALVAVTSAGLLGCAGGATNDARHAEPARPATTPAVPPASPAPLVAHSAGRLPAPVQDPATAALPSGGVVLMGGLDSADVSVAGVEVAGSGRAKTLNPLPVPVHDAAAAPAPAGAYMFGGGEPSKDAILKVGTRGRTGQAGQLPAAASDVGAAALNGTYYVVGGYTGTTPLRTIDAWRPGSRAHVVARLPVALRYAAVAAAGGRLIIAGGTIGTAASRAVYAFDPSSRSVHRIATLPRPLTHAAAATLGDAVYVIGGRGAGLASQTRSIRAIDTRNGRVRAAGHLPRPLSDTGAATVNGAIVVAGGRDGSGTVRSEVMRLTPRVGPARLRPLSSLAPRAYNVPPLLDKSNVYAADAPNRLSPVVRHDRPLIYVPNSKSNTVDEIDPNTYKIVRHFAVGALPQHVVPSYDLKTLWVNDDKGNSLTPIDPRNGKPGKPVHVLDPYNLYFTPDGRFAVVMAEGYKRIDFRDPHTMKLRHSLPVPMCPGVNHADFTADGRYMLASCEYSARMIVVDVPRQRVVRTIALPRSLAAPQDVKLSPDGRVFYVADMISNGVWKIGARSFRPIGFIRTGAGAHGLYVSRDSRFLYVSNRSEGSVSLISLRTRKPVREWRIPGGGSPDMGGVSADGRTLWLAGRYSSEVYAIDTRTGKLRRRIKVGLGPHGLCVYPQPGRYSLGHTGVFR